MKAQYIRAQKNQEKIGNNGLGGIVGMGLSTWFIANQL